MIVPIVEKIAEQKIIAMHWTGGYTFLHRPAGWAFAPLRGYASHWAGFVDWATTEWKEKRKPRVANSIFEGVAGKDIASSLDPWLGANSKIEFAFGKTMWHDPKPVDLSGFVRKIMEEGKPDYLLLGPTSVSVAAFYSSLRELGYQGKVKILNPNYQGLDVLAKMLGADMLEGDYEANPINFSPGTKAHKIYQENIDKYAKGNPWGGVSAQAMFNILLLARVVERTVQKVGPANLTGQALYDALNKGEFKAEELYGLSGDIKFTPDDRLAGIETVHIYQMQKGKVLKIGEQKMPFIKMPYMKN